jgi:branched-chain amino acid transport system substrate-binding protein
MIITKRSLLASALAAGALPATGKAQTKPTIRIGVMNDQSSSYRDNGGIGSVACVRMAVSEFAPKLGLTVEVLSADHGNKPDLAVSLARQWLDNGVDAICDLQNSAIALALNGLMRERDKVVLATNVGTAEITGKACSPNLVHFAYDSSMLARVAGTQIVKDGGDTWYFIRPDYAFGRAIQDDATTAIDRAGGKVIGSIAQPFPTTDFSSALLQAQQSKAKIIGLANGGDELVNVVKQAGEFGILQGGQHLAAMLVFINNVHSMGLQAAQGLRLVSTFYWDRNDPSRAFTRRAVDAGFNRAMRPNMSHAACYAGTAHYLKAVAALGAEAAKHSGAAVVARMKQMPIESDVYDSGSIREDGRAITPAYLFEIKAPADSKGDWDYYKLLQTVPADQAWRPLSEGGCPLVHS